MTDLHEGELYRTTTYGARIIERTHEGGTAWSYTNHHLDPDDVIRYCGRQAGLGHDNVDHDVFEVVDSDTVESGIKGEFSPNCWGSADRDYLAHHDQNSTSTNTNTNTDAED